MIFAHSSLLRGPSSLFLSLRCRVVALFLKLLRLLVAQGLQAFSPKASSISFVRVVRISW